LLEQNTGRDDLANGHELTDVEVKEITDLNKSDLDRYAQAQTIFERRLHACGGPWLRYNSLQ